MIRFLCAILLVFLIIYGGCSRDFKEVKLKLYGLILPGKATSNDNIVAKYIWEGGGNLREIARVKVDYNSDMITIIPYGLLDLRERAFPFDIFMRTDTVSLGPLPEGSYTIKLVGETLTYYDTLGIPTDAPDSLFQFHVTAISRETGDVVSGLPLELILFSPSDTILRDTTDLTGFALFEYSNSNIDSLVYILYCAIQTWAKLGVPEVITIGVSE